MVADVFMVFSTQLFRYGFAQEGPYQIDLVKLQAGMTWHDLLAESPNRGEPPKYKALLLR
jgi:hypothetical protein